MKEENINYVLKETHFGIIPPKRPICVQKLQKKIIFQNEINNFGVKIFRNHFFKTYSQCSPLSYSKKNVIIRPLGPDFYMKSENIV